MDSEFQKYCAVEIVHEMRLLIFGKNHLRKNWYFFTGVCNLLLNLEQHIPKKADVFLCRKNMRWFNRAAQQHGTKDILQSTSSGQQIFFRFAWLNIKTNFEIIMVTIVTEKLRGTFHRIFCKRNFRPNRWRDV